MELGVLKLIVSWLNDRQAFGTFRWSKSKTFHTYVDLSQVSLYLFIVYHCDLVACLGAYSSHMCTGDLNAFIASPISRGTRMMIQFLEEEETTNQLSKNCSASFPLTSKIAISERVYGEPKTTIS